MFLVDDRQIQLDIRPAQSRHHDLSRNDGLRRIPARYREVWSGAIRACADGVFQFRGPERKRLFLSKGPETPPRVPLSRQSVPCSSTQLRILGIRGGLGRTDHAENLKRVRE